MSVYKWILAFKNYLYDCCFVSKACARTGCSSVLGAGSREELRRSSYPQVVCLRLSWSLPQPLPFLPDKWWALVRPRVSALMYCLLTGPKQRRWVGISYNKGKLTKITFKAVRLKRSNLQRNCFLNNLHFKTPFHQQTFEKTPISSFWLAVASFLSKCMIRLWWRKCTLRLLLEKDG